MVIKVADILSKPWLMGVRRGWLSLLKPQINGWQDVFNAINRLQEFTNNLHDQIKFVRRRREISEALPESQELEKLFKTLKNALSDQKSTATHWYEAEKQDPSWIGRGSFTREQGEHMRRLYETDFASLMTTYVKTRPNPSKRQWDKERSASLTELLDKILEQLRQDAKHLEETMQLEEQYGFHPTRDVFREPMFKEFNLDRMRVVILDPNITGAHVREYIRHFSHAQALLRKNGFSKLWYGVVLVQSREYEKLSPHQLQAYRDLGYETLESKAGTYHAGEDIWVLTAPNDKDIVRIVCHELGHRYWYKFMRSAQRARFNSLVQTNPTEKYRDYPSGQLEKGIRKPVTPVSDYGASTIEEAFAEAFERYVTKREMNRDQLESLRSVMGSSRERVADRFLSATQDPKTLIKKIQSVLSPDLLLRQWRGNPNPLAGHCYAASEALYHMLGGKAAGLKPHSAPCPGGVHWWIQRGGTIMDPTGGQFDPRTLKEIHSQGRGRGFMTKQPSNRASKIIHRVEAL